MPKILGTPAATGMVISLWYGGCLPGVFSHGYPTVNAGW